MAHVSEGPESPVEEPAVQGEPSLGDYGAGVVGITMVQAVSNCISQLILLSVT